MKKTNLFLTTISLALLFGSCNFTASTESKDANTQTREES
jgi:hypothetical protein